MGAGFRIFLVDDDDSLHRLPMARYQRLRRREPGESLPQFAGKRVRCAMVVLEVVRGNPISIDHIDYYMLTFDDEGRVDTAELEKEARLAVEALPPYIDEEQSGRVIDARTHFAKKRYQHEFKWTPTPEIQAAIVSEIFNKEPA
jgi:hypothetical protein